MKKMRSRETKIKAHFLEILIFGRTTTVPGKGRAILAAVSHINNSVIWTDCVFRKQTNKQNSEQDSEVRLEAQPIMWITKT